jgi:hypothetical protein
MSPESLLLYAVCALIAAVGVALVWGIARAGSRPTPGPKEKR